MKIVGVVTTCVVLGVVSAIWSGYVLTVLWAWFVSTTFGLATLSLPAAIGISLVVGYLTDHNAAKEKSDPDEEFGLKLFSACVMAFAKPAVALGIGAVVNIWM